MARRPDVARLSPNPHIRGVDPLEALAVTQPSQPDAIEWNILKVNADDLWAVGYTGQGVVVGGQRHRLPVGPRGA